MARRFFVSPLPPAGPTPLSPRLGHHLGRTVRTNPGDTVVLFDGAGNEASATVLAVDARQIVVDVGARSTAPLGRVPRLALDVAVALPKKRADWLFEHGTEAGIRSFWPLLTARANRLHDETAHWRRVLIAAAAQCDRAILPTIRSPLTVDELCRAPLPAARFVATAADIELGPTDAAEALLVVGPEGGFTAAEIAQLLAAGFAPRSLGPLTLRTETAVLAGATRLLMHPDAAGSDQRISPSPPPLTDSPAALRGGSSASACT
ncbi:MAG: RsmE family RNA methyltransferase [Planctomycetota bacterium]